MYRDPIHYPMSVSKMYHASLRLEGFTLYTIWLKKKRLLEENREEGMEERLEGLGQLK